MSHGHTHGPGEDHSHSHGPPQGQGPQPPQQMVAPPPDPVMQAVIDASFRPVDLAVQEAFVFCNAHKLEKCEECDVDYGSLNRLTRLLVQNPNLRCPPPAKVVNPQMGQVINNMKEEGNVSLFSNF
jgi:translocation protein SEC72